MSSRIWILLVAALLMPVSCKQPAQSGKKGGGSQNANPDTDTPASRPDPVEEGEEEGEGEEIEPSEDKCKNKTNDKKEDDKDDDEDDEGLDLTGKKPKAQAPKKKSMVAAFSLLATVNYNDDIESIFSDKCVACHSGDDKYALDTWTKAKKIKDKIQEQVDSGKMPPKNKAPLTSLEKKTIKEWVEAGAPENSSGSTSDDEEEETEEKDDDKDDECDDEEDSNASNADWDDLLKPKEVEKCKDDGKIFDRLAEKCHKAKTASFECTRSGVLAKFKEYSINVEKQYDEFVDSGYKLDQCGEYEKEPIVFFYKKKEEKEELKLLIKKLCKKGSPACDN